MITVHAYNHYSLKTKYGLRYLSNVCMTNLVSPSDMWHKYVNLVIMAYNTFKSPRLANLSPYELVFL